MTEIEHLLELVDPLVRQYGLIAVPFIITLESLGAPLPGEPLLIFGSVMAEHGNMSFPLAASETSLTRGAIFFYSEALAIPRYSGMCCRRIRSGAGMEDAAARFASKFNQRYSYDVVRLIATANIFDILLHSVFPPGPPILSVASVTGATK
jgi:hypothetical protein